NRDNCKKEVVNLDKEMYLYNMYIERLTSNAYRNLISREVFEAKIMKELKINVFFDTNSNITKKEYLNMDEHRQISYIDALSRLAQVYEFKDSDRIMVQIHELYDSVATIASLGFTEHFILTYNPLKKLYLGTKYSIILEDNTVATIASLEFTKQNILKYNPLKKLFLRKK